MCVCVRVHERASERDRERERERGDSVGFWERGEGQGAVGQVRGARGELAVLRFTGVVLAVLLSHHFYWRSTRENSDAGRGEMIEG